MNLELGTPVRCTDAPIGELADVVIDPRGLRVTHLVVSPRRRHGAARLIPVEEVTVAGSEIALSCTLEEARRRPHVQDFAYLRLDEHLIPDPDWDVGIETMVAAPNAGYGQLGEESIAFDQPWAITYDRIPKGEAEIRRASDVLDADGVRVGHAGGFVVRRDGSITHVLLERGHLWGRRELAIPIEAITRVATDSVTINLTKAEVGALGTLSVNRGAVARG